MSKKKTVGAHSRDLLLKQERCDHSHEEQAREQLENFEKELQDCFIDGKKYYNDTFYIVVITKKERLMPNVIRNLFLHRSTCPSPQYDETVYKVNSTTRTVEFQWVVPAKDICEYLYSNALTIPEEQKALRQFVLDFYDGTLLHKAKVLNGEIDA